MTTSDHFRHLWCLSANSTVDKRQNECLEGLAGGEAVSSAEAPADGLTAARPLEVGGSWVFPPFFYHDGPIGVLWELRSRQRSDGEHEERWRSGRVLMNEDEDYCLRKLCKLEDSEWNTFYSLDALHGIRGLVSSRWIRVAFLDERGLWSIEKKEAIDRMLSVVRSIHGVVKTVHKRRVGPNLRAYAGWVNSVVDCVVQLQEKVEERGEAKPVFDLRNDANPAIRNVLVRWALDDIYDGKDVWLKTSDWSKPARPAQSLLISSAFGPKVTGYPKPVARSRKRKRLGSSNGGQEVQKKTGGEESWDGWRQPHSERRQVPCRFVLPLHD